MSVNVEIVAWDRNSPDRNCRPADLIPLCHSRDYIGVMAPVCSKELIAQRVNEATKSDVIVVYAAHRRKKWNRLREFLSPYHYLMTAIPEFDPFIAFSVSALQSNADLVTRCSSFSELTLMLASKGTVAFVEASEIVDSSPIPVPNLTTPSGSSRFPWLRDHIDRIRMPGCVPTDLAALKAGLYLLNDFFDESHSCSQSIEGLGQFQTGDYWHAILHRCEPDAGNAKYWFRRLGRHPVHAQMFEPANQLLNAATGSVRAKLDRWKHRLIPQNRWDPIAFVDLCSACDGDSELQDWCEQLQHEEMLLLLETTFRQAMGK